LIVADIPQKPRVHRFASDKNGNTIVEKLAVRNSDGLKVIDLF